MGRLRLWLLLLTGILLWTMSAAVSAQDERLTNPGLEEGSVGPYTTRRGGEFPIYLPNGWNVWLASPTGEFFNRGDRTTINPHPGPGPSPQEGSRALNIDCGYVTCTVAIYQQVSVEPDQNIQASAFAQVKACNLPENGDTCGSAVESGAQTRIGIDPNGGTDPNDSDIVWSNWAEPHDRWDQMSVSATTTGTTATLFLYSRQGSTADLNKTYWDRATLTGGGSGGAAEGAPAATPVPTAPPSVAFVSPQDQRPDGSIVHVVGAGDTVDSIAVAYRVTRQHILDLNQISDPRIISIGQEILIREPLPSEGETLTEEIEDDTPRAETTEEQVPETTDETTEDAVEAPESETTEDPAAETTEPVEEATPAPPTATPAPAPVVSVADGAVVPARDPSVMGASVCVALFNDLNQNRIQDVGEDLLAGGTINLNNAGETVQTRETDGVSEPFCFEELAAGDYTVAASAPTGYGLTSPDQLRLQALAGVKLDVAFGAAEGVQPLAPPPAEAGDLASEPIAEQTAAASPLDGLLANSGLIVFGLAALVLVGGIGVSLLLRRR